MKKILLSLVLTIFALNCFALTSGEMLNKVKKLESGLVSFEASLNPQGNKGKLKKMGEKFDLLTDIKNGNVKYKKGNRIRVEGKLQGIKVSAVENGYKIKFNLGPFKGTQDNKEEPGRRYSSVDLCFLSSWLWANNKVTILSTDAKGICKCKFDPIQGGDEKRHDLIWIDSKTLKMVRREKYNTDGILKLIIVYKEWKEMLPGYWVATKYQNYNPQKELIGINQLTNIKVNKPISDDLFVIK